MALLEKYFTNPVRKFLGNFAGFLLYFFESLKRKYACKIVKITIFKDNPTIKYSILYKQVSYVLSPKEILEDQGLLSRFSPKDAAIIGILSCIDLTDDSNKENQLNKIKSIFPKLSVLINER